MDSLIIHIKQLVGVLLSPPACASCKKKLSQRTVFCSECERYLLSVAPVPLKITQNMTVMVHAACLYQDPVRKLVLQKRSGIIAGSYALAELIWQKTVLKNMSCDVIVPVPLHWTRILMRGFNQAREMGKILARKKGCACVEILKREKRTAYQSDLPIEHRAANVREAFVLRASARTYVGKHIILLDDLMTTGSTLRAAAKVLLTLKPASLTIIVACRTLIEPRIF